MSRHFSALRAMVLNSLALVATLGAIGLLLGRLLACVSYLARVQSFVVTAPNVPLVNLPVRTGQVLALILACVYAGDAAAQSNRIEFQICPYDTGLEDDDYVHIWFGNNLLENLEFDRHRLTNQEECKKLTRPKGTYTITVRAINEGVRPPNTAAIVLRIGGEKKAEASWTLKTDEEVEWQVLIAEDDIVINPLVLSLIGPNVIAEAKGVARVMVRSPGGDVSSDRTVNLTFGGKATPGKDYDVLSSQLTIIKGQSSVSANIVEAIQDELIEGDETVVITASSDGKPAGSIQLTILDDDETTWDLRVPASITEASGEVTITVDTGGVTFDSAQTIALTVSPSAADDLSGVPTQLTIPAGESTASATFQVVDDDIVEGTEAFTITASSGGDMVGSAQVTIRDDDEAEIKVTETVLMLSEGIAESQGAVDTFSIELGSQPASPVTVTVRSSDVSAVTVTPTSPLRFTSRDWNVAQDVTVHAVEDSDADNEMVTITYEVNGPGAYAGLVPDDDVMVMVQVIDDDVSQPERELVEDTVRTVTATTVSNITTNIGARFSAARTGTSLTSLSLAGRSVTQPSTFEETGWNALWNQESHSRTLSSDDLLRSTDFQIVLGASEGTLAPTAETWTFWGRGDLQYFSSQPSQGSSYNGDLRAGYFGLDTQVDDQWLAGVAVSRTMAEANYVLGTSGADNDGTMDVTLTSLIPYVRFAPDDENELWAIVGVGQGQIENTRPNATAEQESSDAAMLMASAGGRHAVALGDPLDWALLGDVGFGRVLTEDGVEAIAGLTVDTWQARLGVEGSYTADLGDESTLTTFIEVAGRYDGGDEGEAGLELSPGMYIATPDDGFGFELRGRALVLHSAENYEEYGLSATASVTPRPDGTGLSLSLSPRWGDETGGADTLWRDDGLGLLGSPPSDRNAMSLDARVGYGVKAMNGLLTPFSEFGLRDEDSQYWRIGARFDRTHANPGALSLELSGERRQSLSGDPEHRVGVTSWLRF